MLCHCIPLNEPMPTGVHVFTAMPYFDYLLVNFCINYANTILRMNCPTSTQT